MGPALQQPEWKPENKQRMSLQKEEQRLPEKIGLNKRSVKIDAERHPAKML
jgi:hypothetical protein